MSASTNLVNQYLLATPSIRDPLFAASVVYLCEHSEHGSMGVVINHLSDQSLGNVFEQLEIDCDFPEIRNNAIFIGGPVKLQQGFVLHDSDSGWENSLKVAEHCYLTSSRDILEAIARREGPSRYLVLLGYSGWSAGQLEREMQENSWLTTSAKPEITFNPDVESKWQTAFDSLGFDLDSLSPTTGNA